jgi:acetylornithine/succinyldiaminopimelate/putrescine aminotransferase
VRSLGERLRERVATLPHVVEIRGRGLMVACDFDLDAPDIARRALLEQRLVVNATGPVTLRMLPPLVIGEDEIDDCVERLRAVLS